MHCLLWRETGIEVRAQSAEYKTEFMIHYTSVCVSVRDTGREIMKPRPVLLVYYAAVRLLLISITSPDSFSHHTPVSLTTNYFVRVEMNRRTVFAGLQSDEGDDRKGCFLSRQRRTGCWCADVEHGPEAHPRLPARRSLSPIGYKAAPLWRAFPASSPGGTARYVNEAATCSHSWRTEDGAERLAGSRPRHLVGRKLC